MHNGSFEPGWSFQRSERLMKAILIKPKIVIWGALLNGCQIHENVFVANEVRNQLPKLVLEIIEHAMEEIIIKIFYDFHQGSM